MKSKIFSKLLEGLNFMALALAVQTANAACIWIFHQPKFPEKAKKYNRIDND